MSPQEIRFRCLELAVEIAKASGKHAEHQTVAEIQKWLYALTEEPASTGPVPKQGQSKEWPLGKNR